MHDTKIEMEEDDLVAAGSVALPIGSPRSGHEHMDNIPTRVGLHDFQLLSVVGQGAFGKVGARKLLHGRKEGGLGVPDFCFLEHVSSILVRCFKSCTSRMAKSTR